MKKILFSICFLAGFIITDAQKKIDIVYLQDGSVIKGIIVEQNEKALKIETCCGSVFSFQTSEITKIEQDESVEVKSMIKERGYMNYTSMGILYGSTANEKQAPLSLLMEHNYRIDKYFAAGVTVGYEFLNESTIPLAVNLKILFPLGKPDLFMGISGGYNFSVENPQPDYYTSYTGGVMINSELGVIFPLSQQHAVFVAAGYRYNELHYTMPDWWWGNSGSRTYFYNRISIRFGWILY